MLNESVDLKTFLVTQLESSTRGIMAAMQGLSLDQLAYAPAYGSNSIAWLAWHLSRYRDEISALAAGVEQTWIEHAWYGKFNLLPENDGIGDSPDDVAAFRPDPELLLNYVEAVHADAVKRVQSLTDHQLNRVAAYVFPTERPAWRALASMLGDSAQHAGQINYLRGMISGFGWLSA